ncbi:MAG: NmrA family protein, partial [Ferruginibacter sp.]|nr:NmrA family protein [Ferruginibacter sp.]
ATCVVLGLAGLKEFIVEIQSLLPDAALAAGVPRFIPSGYSAGFTQVPKGENRNFDLGKESHERPAVAPIAGTSIMNGAFPDILFYNTPFFNLKNNSVAYWGTDPNSSVDFTTKDDTAAFSAACGIRL